MHRVLKAMKALDLWRERYCARKEARHRGKGALGRGKNMCKGLRQEGGEQVQGTTVKLTFS